jgi:hypothetical protein
MNHPRGFWNELLVTLEESLAAFSGVNPDLIDASATIPKHSRRDGSRFGSSVPTSPLGTRDRNSETQSKTINRGR